MDFRRACIGCVVLILAPLLAVPACAQQNAEMAPARDAKAPAKARAALTLDEVLDKMEAVRKKRQEAAEAGAAA